MKAVVITQEDPQPTVEVRDVDEGLLEGDTVIAVEYSTLNFKDAMVTQAGNRVARRSPLIGGVDLAGRIVESADPALVPGTSVVAHCYGIGVSHHGGFASLARVPSSWVVPLGNLTTRAAMIYGTAGFTAMASIQRLEHNGLTQGDGPILVTGATGGVGSTAVALLARAGYHVVASSGKASEHAYLTDLGAQEIIGRDEIDDKPERTLGTERWAGAIDCVGGSTLAAILRTLHYRGAVAASGLTGGNVFESTVYPFIVRANSLIGIDAVEMALDERTSIWHRLDGALEDAVLESIVASEIGLDDVPTYLREVASGAVRGRVLVDATKD
jgi:acrylyl-CoA reductase (NADPH)